MLFKLLILISCFYSPVELNYIFPRNFKFGVATSSYQIEGAWNVSGKGESIWDYYTHTFPKYIIDGSNGDIACDSYNQIDVDIDNLNFLKVDFYRFSINWPRLLPKGTANYINEDGLRYYNELIDKLIDNDIEPIVTLYHWELPQSLQDLGGWTNSIMIAIFEDYARVAFQQFGDRVKTWITFNEPFSICAFTYEYMFLAPFISSKGVGSYLCGHNLLLAHANVYHMYKKEFYKIQEGRIGITVECPWYEPFSNSTADKIAVSKAFDVHLNWFTQPIFSQNGDYPSFMRCKIDTYSWVKGYRTSRLPTFTSDQISLIKNSSDFLGLNHYTSLLVKAEEEIAEDMPSFDNDAGFTLIPNPAFNATARDAFRVHPEGLRLLLNYIKNKYDNPLVIITENGYAGFDNETIDDDARIWFYNGYLRELSKAIEEDNCNVEAYTGWSFMDNYEWSDGYTMRFGFFYVNFTDPDRLRTPKKSAHVFRNIITSKKVT